MYEGAKIRVRINSMLSNKFEVKVRTKKDLCCHAVDVVSGLAK